MISLIEITPLNRFFFGGPEAFGDENHFVSSEYFPQNTQLLGALRRWLLEDAKLLRARKNGLYVRQKLNDNRPEGDVKRALRLVGEAGMKNAPFENCDDLGKIKRLSPLFILRYNTDHNEPSDALFPIPLDCKTIFEKNSPVMLRPYRMRKIADELLPVDYDVKKTTEPRLGGMKFWQYYLEQSDIPIEYTYTYDRVYHTHTQVGIALEDRRIIENRFYRKIDYTLVKSHQFGCLLEHDDELQLPNSGMMQIGAESVMFQVRTTNIPQSWQTDHPVIRAWIDGTQIQDSRKVVAIGEAFVADTRDPNIDFAFTPWFKSEKILQSKTADAAYRYNGKSPERRLAPRGSVFYFKHPKLLEAAGAYAKIGYNFFLNIPHKENL